MPDIPRSEHQESKTGTAASTLSQEQEGAGASGAVDGLDR